MATTTDLLLDFLTYVVSYSRIFLLTFFFLRTLLLSYVLSYLRTYLPT